jgi:tetratricopeptide (TPR) repeat protein
MPNTRVRPSVSRPGGSGAATVTVLFSQPANVADLLRRGAEERAQRILRAHYRLVEEATRREIRWLGDGLAVRFVSAAETLGAAIAIQQTARRPVDGEAPAIRIAVHSGEALAHETDWFGPTLMIARRLCGRAAAHEILCTDVVARLFLGMKSFEFIPRGAIDVPGIATAVETFSVAYATGDPLRVLSHMPFVGRLDEMGKLRRRLEALARGEGCVVLLTGEPGIGKSRLAEELAARARADEIVILQGRCHEGEGLRPYHAFAQAIDDYAHVADRSELQQDLGNHLATLGGLVPALREDFPGTSEPPELSPDEERARLFDAVDQFFATLAARAPVIIVLDDLHWADAGTCAMLRHVARSTERSGFLILGILRDAEVDADHPLQQVLASLPRETGYDAIALGGLASREITELIAAVVNDTPPPRISDVIGRETNGNPYFIREVLLNLVEERRIVDDRGWISDAAEGATVVPPSVRQVIARRIGRLRPQARELLRLVSAFRGPFSFETAAQAAGLDGESGLEALEELLRSQLLRMLGDPDTYDFAHALVRHGLYEELSPARRTLLHRAIADALAHVARPQVSGRAGEAAWHYKRSASLPGAERGVEQALLAATRAERAAAPEDAATFLQIALDLLPPGDERRPQILSRLGLALGWASRFQEAVSVVREAGDAIAATGALDAATDYLAEAAMMFFEGHPRGAWEVARQGLRYVGARRDLTWLRLQVHDILRREAENPDDLGFPTDTAERREAAEIASRLTLPYLDRLFFGNYGIITPRSREDALTRFRDDPIIQNGGAGDFTRALALWQQWLADCRRHGRIVSAADAWTQIARCHNALGDFSAARAAGDEAMSIAARFSGESFLSIQSVSIMVLQFEIRLATDDHWEELLRYADVGQRRAAETAWVFGALQAGMARLFAGMGQEEDALASLKMPVDLLDKAPLSDPYVFAICDVVGTLWVLGRADHTAVLERNLRDKVLGPDLRFPMRQPALSMAHVSALQERWDEASAWFARARVQLEETRARPLRALTDYDEGLMFLRRSSRGDRRRAEPLLRKALEQFRRIGMTGWTAKAVRLLEGDVPHAGALIQATPTSAAAAENAFRNEGDYWTVVYEGQMARLKDMKGLQDIARLLASPGEETHVLDLVGGSRENIVAPIGEALPAGDSRARSQYRARLAELQEDLEEAERMNDTGRAARARAELDFIAAELSSSYGLGGRPRTVSDPIERARKAVAYRIRSSIARIRRDLPPLGEHLDHSIETATFCSYAPERTTRWTVVPKSRG